MENRYHYYRWLNSGIKNQSVQSTGVFLNFFNSLLAFEKHLQLMNFPKDRGDGWAVLMTACFFWSISFSFLWAKPPHKIKTTPCCVSLTRPMMASVRLCQPYLEWEFGWWALKIQACRVSGFLMNKKLHCKPNFICLWKNFVLFCNLKISFE